MNQKDRNIIFWILIISIIGLGIYNIYWVKSNSFQCVSNPSKYTFEKLEEANDGEVSCLCNVQKPGSFGMVSLTKDGFQPIIKFNNSK